MNRYKQTFVMLITILRIIGIPFLFIINNQYVLFLYAAFLFITDFIDGFLARKWKVTSTIGAVMDLIADKALVLVILLSATINKQVPVVLFVLIAAREIYSLIMRYTNFKKSKALISASQIGKAKTTFQFIALAMMILNVPGYELMLWFVVFLSYYSFFQYFKIAKGGKK